MKVPNKQAGSDIQFIQDENHRKKSHLTLRAKRVKFTT